MASPAQKKSKKLHPIVADQDTWFLLGVSMRYCIGRSSYAPGLFVDWVKRNWEHIPIHTRILFRRDLIETIEHADNIRSSATKTSYNPLGHELDEKMWREFATWLHQRPPADYLA